MRGRRIGDSLDFSDINDAEIRFPLVILEERIVVGAQILKGALSRDGLIEHSAKGYTNRS
jgi:hypothetical protein